MANIQDAKMRLDSSMAKARIDLYKPIQIAEVLRKSRLEKNIKVLDLKTYQNQSIRWRDEVILNPV